MQEITGQGAFVGRHPGEPSQPGHVGVIDIGSNSVRLVVYDGLHRTPLALFNEKVMCGLGRGLGTTGRLNPEGVESALTNLPRFASLARVMGVNRLDVLATAAVRDAADGPAFVEEVRARCGLSMKIISGAEEGRLSALGVLAGIPDADGIMGDLGGGSVELTQLDEGRPGGAVTLPIGPQRLAEIAGNERRLREAVDDALAGVIELRRGRGRCFYLVGGAWRAIARIHMEQTNYPVHIIQHYTLGRQEAETFLPLIGRMSRKSLEKVTGIARKRLDALPLAAFVLSRLIRAIEPARIIFSAFGLREGHLFDLLPEDQKRKDPLIASCAAIASANRRFGIDAEELARWVRPILPAGDARQDRLVLATALLSDAGWKEHPDYRAEAAFMTALRMPVVGIDHVERIYIATALHARYGGAADDPIRDKTLRLIPPERAAAARTLGLALRLAFTLTGGAPDLLDQTDIGQSDGVVSLRIAEGVIEVLGEAVQRRLDALGRSVGLRTELVRMPPRAESPTTRRRVGRV